MLPLDLENRQAWNETKQKDLRGSWFSIHTSSPREYSHSWDGLSAVKVTDNMQRSMLFWTCLRINCAQHETTSSIQDAWKFTADESERSIMNIFTSLNTFVAYAMRIYVFWMNSPLLSIYVCIFLLCLQNFLLWIQPGHFPLLKWVRVFSSPLDETFCLIFGCLDWDWLPWRQS